MELSLFDSKSVSGSELVRTGRSHRSSLPSFNRSFGVKLCSQFCSKKGNFLKVSSNGTSDSIKVIGSFKQHQLLAETCPFEVNGRYGTSTIRNSRSMMLLDAMDDEYGGVLVNPERLPADPDVFRSSLFYSLSHWKLMRKKGIWLKLPVDRSELVPVAVKAGFEYHHAERGYLMLTYWIPDGPSILPANASHQVGVGGFVVNDQNEVLVVQEKYCAPSLAGLWKIPTGFLLESEEIFSGAVREVKEETGVDTEFVEVIAFRHAHNVAFEKSDLYFICMLKPLSTQIKVDDFEVQAAKWMPLHEFVEQPLIRGDSMFKQIIDICIARLGKQYCGLSPHRLISIFDGKQSSLYYNVINSPDVNCSAD